MGGGRSYEFNPETSDEKSFSRSLLRDNKEQVTRAEPELPGEPKISYGRKFSQTEEMYTVHQMNRELEELARRDGEESPSNGNASNKRSKAQAKPAGKVTAELPPPPEVRRSAPIGALPGAVEPPPKQRLTEVLEEAERYLGAIQGGARDIVNAGLRLARLPFEVAALAAQRLRMLRA